MLRQPNGVGIVRREKGRGIKGALAAACLAVSMFAPHLIFGQAADGNLTGTVLDASGAAVAGSTVEVENSATGVKTATKTDGSGSYRINNLLIGSYTVTTTAAGFTTATLKQVAVELNKTTTLN